MSTFPTQTHQPAILLVGASRGLGHAMASEFLQRGWKVVGTIRSYDKTALHDLADRYPLLEIEHLDMNVSEEISALGERLGGRSFNILFVNAGTANHNQEETIAEVSTEEFVRVMVTNALSPMRVIESLQSHVTPSGLIGVMSSGQGSIANNERGGHEVYRGTKAALNQYMRSYAARHASEERPLVLMAPGWIRTELGGPDAPLCMEEAIPMVVDVLLAQQGKPGLQYLDREGRPVPW
jgi:NAD(P)-dependent dehydrogenase (short-subunit alcohol dehydrogenase family)